MTPPYTALNTITTIQKNVTIIQHSIVPNVYTRYSPASGSSSVFPQRGAETEMFWLPVHGKDGVLHTWRRAKSHSPAPAADLTNPQEWEETEILAVHAGNRICLEFRVHEFGPLISKCVRIISYMSGEHCRNKCILLVTAAKVRAVFTTRHHYQQLHYSHPHHIIISSSWQTPFSQNKKQVIRSESNRHLQHLRKFVFYLHDSDSCVDDLHGNNLILRAHEKQHRLRNIMTIILTLLTQLVMTLIPLL